MTNGSDDDSVLGGNDRAATSSTSAQSKHAKTKQKRRRKSGRSQTSDTPTKRKKKNTNKKVSGFESPASTSNKITTPSSVASKNKFLSDQSKKRILGMRLVENELTENERIETVALETISKHSSQIEVNVNNSMWPFVSECNITELKDKEVITFTRNQVNHNHVNPNLANEITNNFLGNPINADLSGKTHKKSMGGDMKCLLTWNKLVNSC